MLQVAGKMPIYPRTPVVCQVEGRALLFDVPGCMLMAQGVASAWPEPAGALEGSGFRSPTVVLQLTSASRLLNT